MTTSDIYHLVLPIGNEGPFTADELRDLIRRGRVRAGDRIYHPVSHATSEVRQVVHDADALEKIAIRPSDRIRRTTSDRQQAVARAQTDGLRAAEAAPAAPTRTSDRLPALPPPEPTAATPEPRTSERTLAIADPARKRRLVVAIGCLLLAMPIWIYAVWWYPEPLGGGILHPPPDIPALSAEELAALPDQQLLERLERECLRRLFAADRDPRSAAAVLSLPASHLWIIGSGEAELRNIGIRQALTIERNPQLSPIMPTLAQMASAYRALGLPGPAQALEDALEIVDPGSDDNPYRNIQQRYLAEIATSSATRLAYARAHRSELFPTQ